jgi:glycosyltransferase involved in cell wall biosynthesis
VRTSLEYLLSHTNPITTRFTHLSVGKAFPASPKLVRPIEYSISLWRVAHFVRHNRLDVIHINPSLTWRSLPFHLALLMTIKRFSTTPVLLHFRGWDGRIIEFVRVRPWLCRPLVGILKQANQIVVLADEFKLQLGSLGIRADRVAVLPEMVDVVEFPVMNRQVVRSGQHFRLLFIARLIREKGMWHVVRAMEWIGTYAPQVNIHATIAGSGDELSRLRSYIKKNKLGDRISLPGSLTGRNKISAFCDADIFVFPSQHSEGFPLTVLEALASGLPLVYTPVGALGEILTEENGICLELDGLDGQSLGRAILELVRQPELMLKIGRNNRRLVETRYDAPIICRQIEKIYRQLAGSD